MGENESENLLRASQPVPLMYLTHHMCPEKRLWSPKAKGPVPARTQAQNMPQVLSLELELPILLQFKKGLQDL